MSVVVKKPSSRIFRGMPLGRIIFKTDAFCRYGVVKRTPRHLGKSLGVSGIGGIVTVFGICKPHVDAKRAESRKEKARIDDTLSRIHMWKTLFGTEPMPEIEENAAEKYSGSLSFSDDFDFDRILRRVRKGH
jgi:hypothetical protein